ncbi:hypothetical protein ANN_10819 [Periplaneta americana]|uniref:Reverse transcriptase domain-containing protein n=1 Tax=Periplaneta americana TaxID=6978 RepID=A0ABQ8T5M4_PERAM|nr:hypothetical protein ANN_10819 [Periplaneta americana]
MDENKESTVATKRKKPSSNYNSTPFATENPFEPLAGLTNKTEDQDLLKQVQEILPASQFGFRSHHSCPQQLHRIADTILDSYGEKLVFLVLFLDTEKVFDKVSHDGLLYKIKNHISLTHFRIIKSYLCSRNFSIKYESTQSKSHPIPFGVPQVHDKLTIAHFSDDISVLSKDIAEMAARQLQDFCEDIYIYCNNLRIIMNPLKSKVVIFTYKKKVFYEPITLRGIPVSEHQVVRYRGLTLDTKLTWQCHKVVEEAIASCSDAPIAENIDVCVVLDEAENSQAPNINKAVRDAKKCVW